MIYRQAQRRKWLGEKGVVAPIADADHIDPNSKKGYNVDTLNSQSKPEAHGLAFSPDDGKALLRNASEARVIFRMIALAIDAEDDGSIQFDDGGGADRWGAAVGEACNRLREIRNVSVETAGGECVDWVTPLNLVEALDVSLLYGNSCDEGERLSTPEIACAVSVICGVLEALRHECEDVAVGKLTSGASTAAMH